MTRECPVRFCERLGAKLPGATLPGTLVTRSERHNRLVSITRSAVTVMPGFGGATISKGRRLVPRGCSHLFTSLVQFNTNCSDVGPFWSADFIIRKRRPSVS